jgi:hypothetical protein
LVIYTVHEPPNASPDRLQSAEQLIFVKDGFAPYAAALPPVWMLFKRMWLEAAIYMGATGLIAWALTEAGAPNASTAILLIIQIILGFEAGALYSASLERRGWRLVGTVAGRNSEDCERRFLEVWLPTRTEIPRPPATDIPFDARPSWAQTALAHAKEAVARGRRALAGT